MGQATIYTQHLDFLFHSATFMFFVSYLYGYGISFIFGTRKTFAISFFIVIITAAFLLLFDSSYVLVTQCFMKSHSHCLAPQTIIYGLVSWLTIFIINFFLNIIIGATAVGVGVMLYFPSEYILARYFNVTFHEEVTTTIHTEDYVPTTNAASANGVNTFLKINRQPVPQPPSQGQITPLMPPAKVIKTK
jgi:hypothetical protein